MAPAAHISTEELIAARAAVANLCADNPVYLPIFARLDAEVQKREAATLDDPIERARAMAQSAMA